MKTKVLFRFVNMLISAFGIGLAVALCYQTGWGADPITVFFSGLNITFKVSLGIANTITAMLMIVIVFFLNKKQLGLGTIVTPFFVQFGIDLGGSWLPVLENIYLRVFLLAIGFLGLGFCIALNICSNMGRSSYDALVLSLSGLLKKSYTFIRWFVDGSLLVLGILLGGRFTFANVLAAVVIGWIVDFFIIQIRKKWLPEQPNT